MTQTPTLEHAFTLRVATPEVSERLARSAMLAPSTYAFRTAPRFTVAPGRPDWLMRHIFVASCPRLPQEVRIDVYALR